MQIHARARARATAADIKVAFHGNVIIRGSIFSRFPLLVEFALLKLIPFAMGDR
jgi:hypothetical protein